MKPHVYNILADAAGKWPEKVAIYDSEGEMTFSQLYNSCNILKEELENRGIYKGKGLGIMAGNSREFIIALFAGIGSGATVMPLSHQLRENELMEIIAESKLHALLTERALATSPFEYQNIDTCPAFLFSKTIFHDHGRIAPHVSHPAFIRFTSGTTGKAKGVVISHSSVYERIKGAKIALNLNEDDVVVWVLPMAYHFIASIALYIYAGAAIVIAKNFMAPTVLGCINKYRGTLLYASPMHLRMLSADTSGMQIESMKTVISTSTAISKEIGEAFYKRYKKPVVQAYGIIEIGLPVINKDYARQEPDSVGQSVSGYETTLFDEKGMEVPQGMSGILGIRGPGMFDAYLNPPLLREEVLVNGYFLTADYAIKDERGLLFIKGRKGSVINIAGNKVFPEEVENLIKTLPQIKECQIVGAPHPIMGQIVQANIVLKKRQDIDEEELIRYCRKNLSTFKIPQRVKKVEAICMTDSGKIKRH